MQGIIKTVDLLGEAILTLEGQLIEARAIITGQSEQIATLRQLVGERQETVATPLKENQS